MFDDRKIRSLLAIFYPAWIDATATLRSLGNAGGFSGALFWKVESGGTSYALHRWPESAVERRAQLHWSHNVLREARDRGCRFVPVPLPTVNGESLILYDDTLWQLEPWMPGVADFGKHPTKSRLQNTMRALATFHQAVGQQGTILGMPASISGRIERLQNWFIDGRFTFQFGDLQKRAARHQMLGSLGETICQQFQRLASSLEENLARFRTSSVPIQPVIGDVWHDHILLTGDNVAGIIDFGAMKNDSIALDFGRLAGSLVGDDPVGWGTSIEVYRTIHPLSDLEFSISRTLDSSGTALGGMNWLNWICIENRQMGSPMVVFNRLQQIALRMETLQQKL